MLDLFSILMEHGLPTAIVGLLLLGICSYAIRDWRTIQKLEARVEKLEEFNRDVLVATLHDNRQTMELAGKAMERMNNLVEKIYLSSL